MKPLLLALALAPSSALAGEAAYFPSRAWVAENADILRADEYMATFHRATDWIPEEMRDPALTKVTRDFGKSVIQTSRLPIQSGRTNTLPKVWSSYWYPLYERDIFESLDPANKSPLEKYDLLATDRAPGAAGSKVVDFEKSRYSSAVNRWEGLCDAWSLAAITMPEPTGTRTVVLSPVKVLVPPPATPRPAPLKPGEKPKPVPPPQYRTVERKVSFSAGDLKALLLKTFEGIDSSGLQVYGQRFTGKPAELRMGLSYGWVQPDLFADQFHRFLEVVAFQRRQSFVMDHDPSEAVWSEPVDGASYEILPIKGRRDQVFVRTFLYPARQLRKEERDQPGKNEHVREYNYILGGSVDWQGNLRVEYGIWLSKNFITNSPAYKDNSELMSLTRLDSRVSHPDFVYTVNELEFLRRRGQSPDLNVELIDMLLDGKM